MIIKSDLLIFKKSGEAALMRVVDMPSAFGDLKVCDMKSGGMDKIPDRRRSYLPRLQYVLRHIIFLKSPVL